MSLVASDKLISRPWGWEGICPQACLVQNQPLQSILKYISGGTDNNHISTQSGQWNYGAIRLIQMSAMTRMDNINPPDPNKHCLCFWSGCDVQEYKTFEKVGC